MKIKCRDTGEVVYNYSDYLKTKHWKTLRELSFEKAKGVCKACKKQMSENFVCHHKTYARIGRERINHKLELLFQDDVIAVCPECHNDKLHVFVRVPYWAQK